MDSESKVISLKDRPKDGLLLSPKRKERRCEHDHVTVDEHERAIQCDGCGAYLDAFDFVFASACNGGYHFEQINSLKKELVELRYKWSQLNKQVEQLKQQKRYYGRGDSSAK